jgi:hypothetical protein
MTKRIEEIELHSREVQDLLGKVPSWLIRNGTLVVLLLLGVLAAGSWFFKYPDRIVAPVVVVDGGTTPASLTGYVELSTSQIGKVRVGQRVNLKFVNYPYLQFGVVKGVVSRIAAKPAGDSYPLEVSLPGQLVTTLGKRLDFERELKGTAEIVTDPRSLLDRIFSPLHALEAEK